MEAGIVAVLSRDIKKEEGMSKVIMRLCLPEPKVRKRTGRVVQKHKDKTKYTRKCKHKATELRWPSRSITGSHLLRYFSP